MPWCNYNYTMLHILTRNQFFLLNAFFLYIVLFLLLAHILVLFKTLSFPNIQFCLITFVVFFCAIIKPYESLSGSFRLFAGFRCLFPFAQIQHWPMWKLSPASKALASGLDSLLACGLNSLSDLNLES